MAPAATVSTTRTQWCHQRGVAAGDERGDVIAGDGGVGAIASGPAPPEAGAAVRRRMASAAASSRPASCARSALGPLATRPVVIAAWSSGWLGTPRAAPCPR
jgi:hypothetical protein